MMNGTDRSFFGFLFQLTSKPKRSGLQSVPKSKTGLSKRHDATTATSCLTPNLYCMTNKQLFGSILSLFSGLDRDH